jgi:cyanate lyase
MVPNLAVTTCDGASPNAAVKAPGRLVLGRLRAGWASVEGMLVGMMRHEITEQIVVARLAKGLTWQELADAIGKPVMWTTAALLGQHPIPAELGEVLAEILGLDQSAVAVLAAPPMRGGLPTAVPTDPTIYRFYEALQVYGGAIKELVHEQFGDGIMSAINFSVDLQKKSHPSGDRVVVTFDGKFLSYDWISAEC